MSLNKAFARLLHTSVPVIRTNDAAALWAVSPATASKMLARLAQAGHIKHLQRGLWLVDGKAHPWTLHSYLVDPSPSYLSLQTALFHHGMIEQIPTVTHVVSTARTRTIKAAGIGIYMVHQVAPAFFCGFTPLAGGPTQMAVPEKALIDYFYFRPTRTRTFRALPELELPKKFSMKKARTFASLIAHAPRRVMVENLLDSMS